MVMRFFEADGGADMQDVVGKTGEVNKSSSDTHIIR